MSAPIQDPEAGLLGMSAIDAATDAWVDEMLATWLERANP
jgi:hypothetical protein